MTIRRHSVFDLIIVEVLLRVHSPIGPVADIESLVV